MTAVGLCDTGAILDPAAILVQSVNETAHGPALVLYTPAVSSIDCAGIAKGWQIAVFLWGMLWDGKVARELSPFWVDFGGC